MIAIGAVIAVLLAFAVFELERIRRRLTAMRVPTPEEIARAVADGLRSMSAAMVEDIRAATQDFEVMEWAKKFEDDPSIIERVPEQVHQILGLVMLARAKALAARIEIVHAQLAGKTRDHRPGVMFQNHAGAIRDLELREGELIEQLMRADAAAAALGHPREAG